MLVKYVSKCFALFPLCIFLDNYMYAVVCYSILESLEMFDYEFREQFSWRTIQSIGVAGTYIMHYINTQMHMMAGKEALLSQCSYSVREY